MRATPIKSRQHPTELITLGVAVAGIKLGSRELYLHTGPATAFAHLPWLATDHWVKQRHPQPAYPVTVVGTVGQGIPALLA